MEKKNLKLKNNFTQLISQVSKLYKDVSNTSNESYLQGKKEAFEEVLNWFITSHNGELKYLSANSFLNMIQEKIAKTKTALATKINEDGGEEEIKQQVNFSDIKISDNRKRINRYSYIESNSNNYGFLNNDQIVVEDESNVSNVTNSHIPFPFSVSSLINSNSGNSLFINPNQTLNNGITSLNNNSTTDNLPETSHNLNVSSEFIVSNPPTSITSISSFPQINSINQQNNIFGNNSQSLANPFLLSTKKKKK
jgi:hypothetical protein